MNDHRTHPILNEHGLVTVADVVGHGHKMQAQAGRDEGVDIINSQLLPEFGNVH